MQEHDVGVTVCDSRGDSATRFNLTIGNASRSPRSPPHRHPVQPAPQATGGTSAPHVRHRARLSFQSNLLPAGLGKLTPDGTLRARRRPAANYSVDITDANQARPGLDVGAGADLSGLHDHDAVAAHRTCRCCSQAIVVNGDAVQRHGSCPRAFGARRDRRDPRGLRLLLAIDLYGEDASAAANRLTQAARLITVVQWFPVFCSTADLRLYRCGTLATRRAATVSIIAVATRPFVRRRSMASGTVRITCTRRNCRRRRRRAATPAARASTFVNQVGLAPRQYRRASDPPTPAGWR